MVLGAAHTAHKTGFQQIIKTDKPAFKMMNSNADKSLKWNHRSESSIRKFNFNRTTSNSLIRNDDLELKLIKLCFRLNIQIVCSSSTRFRTRLSQATPGGRNEWEKRQTAPVKQAWKTKELLRCSERTPPSESHLPAKGWQIGQARG